MLTVLFVEDDEDDMFFFDEAMNDINCDCDIHYAGCSDDLFHILNSIKPDILFLDLKLPGESGFDCLKRLRLLDESKKIPVIIYTNFSETEFVDECFRLKANFYVLKSPNYETRLKRFRKVLDINWNLEPYPSREQFVVD